MACRNIRDARKPGAKTIKRLSARTASEEGGEADQEKAKTTYFPNFLAGSLAFKLATDCFHLSCFVHRLLRVHLLCSETAGAVVYPIWV